MNSPYRIYSLTDIERLPPLQWLVHGILPKKSFSVIYGPAWVGKSFVALDLAFNIGLGNSWFNYETKQVPVMYIAAGEGGYGLKYRAKAWQRYNDTVAENVVCGLDSVQLHDNRSVTGFLDGLDTLPDEARPRLIIFDTLARCSVGIDENAVEGMGQVVDGVDRIRKEAKAAVMLIHHAGKPDKEGRVTYRGSSALEGAVDTMIEVARDSPKSNKLTLTCKKQKDGKEFFPIKFKLLTVELAAGESAVPIAR